MRELLTADRAKVIPGGRSQPLTVRICDDISSIDVVSIVEGCVRHVRLRF